MPVLSVNLSPAPPEYDVRDQDNMRSAIMRSLEGSWEPDKHAIKHESGGTDELDLGALAGTLVNAQVPESAVTQHETALTILETQITDGTIYARVGSGETITGAWGIEASWTFSQSIKVPTIQEFMPNTGVLIDALRIKDGTIIATDGITAGNAAVGSDLESLFYNADNTNSLSHAVVRIRSGGALGGDPLLRWEVNSLEKWTAGVDNDDDTFRIADDIRLGTGADQMILSGAGGGVVFAGPVESTNAKHDIIEERAADAGVTIDALLIKDNGIPEGAVTAHQAALSIAETQIPDGAILTRVGGTEAITGLWDFQHASGLKIGVITERAADAGVTIDGLLIKDNGIPEGAVTAHEGAIDHDQLTNFAVGEHFTQAAIVATGALNSGSITSDFGNIDIGASNIDAGTVTAATAVVAGNLRLVSDELYEIATDGVAAVIVNHRGFNNGTTQFRDFKVRDGKNTDIMVVTGSTKAVVFSGAVTTAALSATTGSFSSTVGMAGLTATTGTFSGTTKVNDDLWIQSGNTIRLYQTDNSNWSIIRANGTTNAIEFAVVGAAADLTVGTNGVVTTRVGLTIGGDLDHDGDKVGFYTTAPIVKQTGVAVTDAAIHAALVNLGLIAGP